jgi:alanine-glyoxylate transaminase / serine-glyoxylate transaminase / serine-pyruvate transaminase
MSQSQSTHAPAAPWQAPARYLLGPGPSLVSPRVYQAMQAPVLGHLDPAFLNLLDRVQVLLRQVFETENELTLAVSGTGSAAMEAAVANLVQPGDRVLVCENGFFSGRIAEMARRYGAEVRSLPRPWGEVYTPGEVEQALEDFPARVVAMVHAETSTGALQPLEGMAEVVHGREALLLVDAVTSLGGVPVGVDRHGIDACYSASQKCLGSPSGLGPVTFSPRAVEALEARRHPVANWYLDLSLLRRYWGSERAYHHTVSSSLFYALHESLRIIAEEGLEQRWQRHRRAAGLFWDGLEQLGLGLHVPVERRLPTLSTVRVPAGVDEMGVRRRLLEEYNIEIAGGLGELKGQIWRVGLMGYSAREDLVLLLLAALRQVLPGGRGG